MVVAAIGFVLLASESRVDRVVTRLDKFAPAWQFNEFHTTSIAAPPARVYDAIKRALTWIRRAGQALPPGVLNAGGRESLIDVALKGCFVCLADETPRELVILLLQD